jgi:hypothetical protein
MYPGISGRVSICSRTTDREPPRKPDGRGSKKLSQRGENFIAEAILSPLDPELAL